MRYPILVAAALLLPLPAMAQVYQGYQYDHSRRHAPIKQTARIVGLAEEMAQATARTYRAAYSSSNQRFFGWRERTALRRIGNLADSARRFRNEVENHRDDLSRTDEEFQALVKVYVRARDSVFSGNVRSTRAVRDSFRRAEALMGQMVDFYGGFDYYHRSYPRTFIRP